MMRISKLWILVLVYVGVVCVHVSGQSCKLPFSPSFSNRTTTSIDMKWSDLNDSPLGWELEVVKKGTTRTMIPTTDLIMEKMYSYQSLDPSSSYEVYFRTVCDASTKSNWNGPFIFTTVIQNPSNCQINLPIKDNGTETFFIQISDNGLLGNNIFIESVDMVIEHDWPADLKITLESPSGKQVILSEHNGTVTDDFGNIEDPTCLEVTSLNRNACLTLKANKPPFIGTYKPDGQLSILEDGSSSNGLWKLIFFDRALKDVGILKYFNIKFSTEKCVIPEQFTILNVDDNAVTISWEQFPNCNTVTVAYAPIGQNSSEIIFNCGEDDVTIQGLLPNTTYEIFITAGCGITSSQSGCGLTFTTTCEPVSLSESFDSYDTCIEGCSISCAFTSDIWYNTDVGDTQDWIIWNGTTDTDNTGPLSGINDGGKYVYIESNPQLCGIANQVILQSQCLQVISNSSGCDMSFYYHMNGSNIASLSLEISVDAGQNWTSLFEVSGNQGINWQRHTLSLQSFHDQIAMLRFIGVTGDGPLGDIALDQIEFYATTLATPHRYYVDSDGDGYGTETDFIDLCTDITPEGYSILSNDCDDMNANIHPDAMEIQCNGIDENCNGMEDDASSFNPIVYTVNKQDETCNGKSDGSIDLSINGGTGPYDVVWNTSSTGSLLSGLSNGVYVATITDVGGCVLQTSFITISTTSTLNALVTGNVRPTCLGKSDGSINIEHNAGFNPYKYIWSNGSTDKNLLNAPQGIYTVTIEDANNCTTILKDIPLTAKPSILADIRSKRDPTCYGSANGFIELITINGTAPYSYMWNNGDTTISSAMLTAGSYTCTIGDANGCMTMFTHSLTQPASLVGTVINTENIRCFGESNGSIKISTSGGTPPYNYLWNNFSNLEDLFNISAGTYLLTITDNQACKFVTDSIHISQPEELIAEADSIGQANCLLGADGFVRLIVSGGTPDYNFAWNHTDASVPTLNNLMTGNYGVTAYDALGCKAAIPNIFIPYINVPISSSIALIQDNKCYQDQNAIIECTVLNGVAPYDFNWNAGVQYIKSSNKDSINHLPAGNYQLTITDADGCVGISDQISIPEKEPYTYMVTDQQANECQIDSNGSITLEVQGGKLPIQIVWNNGQWTGETINQLSNGVYAAIITDANDCILNTESIQMTSLSDIQVTNNVLNDSDGANNGQICISIQGAVSPTSIQWSNQVSGQNCISGLSQGSYYVTITDALDCSKLDSFYVDNVSGIEGSNAPIISLFPNPSSEVIYLTSSVDIHQFRILSMDGKTVSTSQEYQNSHGNISISTDILEPGMYLLELMISDHKYYKRIIKI